jgi:hypothetical protein
MVQAAIDENYALLQFDGDGVYIENEPEGIDGWRVDQILTSDFFNLKTARGLKYEELMNERELLSRKVKLSPKDKKRLTQITSELTSIPTGENPEEIKNREIINSIISDIKKKNGKIVI